MQPAPLGLKFNLEREKHQFEALHGGGYAEHEKNQKWAKTPNLAALFASFRDLASGMRGGHGGAAQRPLEGIGLRLRIRPAHAVGDKRARPRPHAPRSKTPLERGYKHGYRGGGRSARAIHLWQDPQ